MAFAISIVFGVFLYNMVKYCLAFGCKIKVKKDCGISFHIFLHGNPELLQKWVQAVRRKDWHPTKNSYICGQNFEKSCFVVRCGKRGCGLYDYALSTIFQAFPDHLQKSAKEAITKEMKNIEHIIYHTCATIVYSCEN